MSFIISLTASILLFPGIRFPQQAAREHLRSKISFESEKHHLHFWPHVKTIKRNKNKEEWINQCIKMVNENRIEELTQIKHLQKKTEEGWSLIWLPGLACIITKTLTRGKSRPPASEPTLIYKDSCWSLSCIPFPYFLANPTDADPSIHFHLPGVGSRWQQFLDNVNRAVDPDQSTKHAANSTNMLLYHHEASMCPHRFNSTTAGMQRHTARCKIISNQYSKKRFQSAHKFMKLKFKRDKIYCTLPQGEEHAPTCIINVCNTMKYPCE